MRSSAETNPVSGAAASRVALACTVLLLGGLAVPAQPTGEQPRRLTHDGRRKEDLAWSPDGRTLACSLYHQQGRIGIALLDADGGNLRVLTTARVERSPAWRPDGTEIAFVHVTHSGTDGELDLHAMRPDGTGRRVLVPIAGKSFDNFPSWSPDGATLLFTTTRDGTQEIYTAQADGQALRRLTQDASLKQYPRWSPDGKSVLYNANGDGDFELYVLPMQAGTPRRLTYHPALDTCGTWSPDGRRIAWVTTRDGNPEVYVMSSSGSDPRNVSRHPGYDYSPAWRPDGSLSWVSDRDGGYDVYAARP